MKEIKATKLLKCVKIKLVFVIFLAGFRCAHSYSIIQASDDSTPTFKVYWNVPTFQCASKRIPFTHISQDFGILQNEGDRFAGEKVTILYHPGKFPRSVARDKFEDGGIPQRGDMAAHLEQFKRDLAEKIPDETFDGLGIIDMERWRPIYHQNYGNTEFVKNESYRFEMERHDSWKESWLQAEAKRNFELAAREYMEQSLAIAKEMRPWAQWGYYAFPYCYNMEGKDKQETCSDKTKRQNDETYWLWAESTALYPSLYSRSELTPPQLASLIKGRVAESKRVAAKNTPTFVYFKLKYSNNGKFFSEKDLNTALDVIYQSNASGIIVWDSSASVATPDRCKDMLRYVNDIFGPAVVKYTRPKVETTTHKPNIPSYTDNKSITGTTQTPSLVDLIIRDIANTTNYLNSNVYSKEDITIVVIRKSYTHTAPGSSPSIDSKYNCSDSSGIHINFNEIHYHNSNNTDVMNSEKYVDAVNSNEKGVNNSTDNIISDKTIVNNTDRHNNVVTEVNSTDIDTTTNSYTLNFNDVTEMNSNDNTNIYDKEGINTDVTHTEETITEDNYTQDVHSEESITEENYTDETQTERLIGEENYTGETQTGLIGGENNTDETQTEGLIGEENYTGETQTEGLIGEENYTGETQTEGLIGEENYTDETQTEVTITEINDYTANTTNAVNSNQYK